LKKGSPARNGKLVEDQVLKTRRNWPGGKSYARSIKKGLREKKKPSSGLGAHKLVRVFGEDHLRTLLKVNDGEKTRRKSPGKTALGKWGPAGKGRALELGGGLLRRRKSMLKEKKKNKRPHQDP